MVPVGRVQVQHYEVTTRLDIVGNLIPFCLQSATICVSSSNLCTFLPVSKCQNLMNTHASYLEVPGLNLSFTTGYHDWRFLRFYSVSTNARAVPQNRTKLSWELFSFLKLFATFPDKCLAPPLSGITVSQHATHCHVLSLLSHICTVIFLHWRWGQQVPHRWHLKILELIINTKSIQINNKETIKIKMYS
jgi:hypothetical protein